MSNYILRYSTRDDPLEHHGILGQRKGKITKFVGKYYVPKGSKKSMDAEKAHIKKERAEEVNRTRGYSSNSYEGAILGQLRAMEKEVVDRKAAEKRAAERKKAEADMEKEASVWEEIRKMEAHVAERKAGEKKREQEIKDLEKDIKKTEKDLKQQNKEYVAKVKSLIKDEIKSQKAETKKEQKSEEKKVAKEEKAAERKKERESQEKLYDINKLKNKKMSELTNDELQALMERTNKEKVTSEDLNAVKKNESGPTKSPQDLINAAKAFKGTMDDINRNYAKNPPTKKQPKALDLSEKTDAQLRREMDRAVLESRYNEMFNSPEVSNGKVKVAAALGAIGTAAVVGTQVANFIITAKQLKS